MQLPQISLVLAALLSILALTTAKAPPVPTVEQMEKGRLPGRISTPLNTKKFDDDYLTTTTCFCAAANSSSKVKYFQWDYYNHKGNQTFLMEYNFTTNNTLYRPTVPICRTYKIIADKQNEDQHWKDEFCYVFDSESDSWYDEISFDGSDRKVGGTKGGRKELAPALADERCKTMCPRFMKMDKLAGVSILVAHQKIREMKLKAWKVEKKKCDEDYGCGGNSTAKETAIR
ncbi:hypothetical protein N7G274_007320 [Stereocaulon virgatum]|uniref:Uncharacterized protein n=1 Tax=Stereocaulon virgatum TaxID=373712 RepID=A0ABR4A6A9_9LECA